VENRSLQAAKHTRLTSLDTRSCTEVGWMTERMCFGT